MKADCTSRCRKNLTARPALHLKFIPKMSLSKQVIVSGGFDDIRSRDLRFLEEASKLGELSVLLWPDATLQKLTGNAAKFPLGERFYFLNAVRYVSRVIPANDSINPNELPTDLRADIWADVEADEN